MEFASVEDSKRATADTAHDRRRTEGAKSAEE